jgi:DNA mismatch repair ATPase MutS
VLVLSCSKTYAQVIPSTGEINRTDTSLVTIPINYIHLANQKLIERQYLIETNQYKDSIIVDYKKYVKEQEKAIKSFQTRINNYDRINKDIAKRLERQQKTSLICGSVAAASIAAIVIAALVN